MSMTVGSTQVIVVLADISGSQKDTNTHEVRYIHSWQQEMLAATTYQSDDDSLEETKWHQAKTLVVD